LRRRPLVISGARDMLALGIAVSGMVVVGPVELFLPDRAAAQFGPYVWLLLLSLYGLCVVLVALVQKPRLTVYNVPVAEFRALLSDVVNRLDGNARWVGDHLVAPALELELRWERAAVMRNASLVALETPPHSEGWNRLAAAVAEQLGQMRVEPNPRGATFVLVGLMLVIAIAWEAVSQSHEIAQAFLEMLRL
jgi:hypothetical protein